MARIRTIKPEFWTDSKTGTLSGIATKLFLGILNHADDFGVMRLDHHEMKARILPYEEGAAFDVVIPRTFHELSGKGLITIFEYADETENEPPHLHLHVTNFRRHQRVDKPGNPLLAGWDKESTPRTFGVQPLTQQELTAIRERGESALHRTFPERSKTTPAKHSGKGKERKGSGKEGKKPPKSPKGDKVEQMPIPDGIDTEKFRTVWADWITYRRQKRQPLTVIGATQQLRKMAEIGEQRAIAMILNTIEKGWQGLREPSDNNYGGKSGGYKPGPGQRHPDDVDDRPGVF